MKTFGDLGIKPSRKMFIGDKIKINRLMNREIVVNGFEVRPSKYPDKGVDALILQIEFEGESRIVFTGSKVLIDQITQVGSDDIPFKTIIVKNGEHYEFR
jgi:hypothetical protein